MLQRDSSTPKAPMDDFTDMFLTEPDAVDFEASSLRLTVDLSAVVENWHGMHRLSGNARTAAVVKTDAYGLGIEDCGEALHQAGARDFFVMTAQEGATLRAVAPEARIYVLGGVWPGTEALFFSHDLVPVIASYEQLTFWMSVLADFGPFPCALQVDTGFNRLGLTVSEALDLADDNAMPHAFSPVLVMSHLMCADTPSAAENANQLLAFRKIASAFEGVEASLAASAGIALGDDYHFDLTRPGITLYGGTGGASIPTPLQSVAKAEARILQIRDARAGEAVSYGASQRLSRDSRLAVVSVGYGDGYPRALSGAGVLQRGDGSAPGVAYFNGYRVPVVGKVTMDITIFDVTDIPEKEVKSGDYLELFGPNLPLSELAASAGSIEYELLTGLGLRYERRYLPVQEI